MNNLRHGSIIENDKNCLIFLEVQMREIEIQKYILRESIKLLFSEQHNLNPAV